MSVAVGRVVAVMVGKQSARPGIVTRTIQVQGASEPRIDAVVVWELDRGDACAFVMLNLPFTDDDKAGQGLSWKYPGPEVLVRGPVRATTEGAS